MSGSLPLPPEALVRRAGYTPGGDVTSEYLAGGALNHDLVCSLLPAEWSIEGRRVLDFGCGAGKVLRHFAPAAEYAEFWGCDIDEASVAWLDAHMCPPFHVFRNGELPPLQVEESYFDLIYAISVFTHLAATWSRWLLELHRVLKPGGVLVASLLGEGMSEPERAGRWDADLVGMNILRAGQDWAGGGPTVFHSRWWIEAHWGRLFKIVRWYEAHSDDGRAVPGSHCIVVTRRLAVEGISAPELEALEPGEAREIAALQHNISQLHEDDRWLRGLLADAVDRGDREHERRVAAELELTARRRRIDAVLSSPTRWLTASLERLGRGVRSRAR
jgi:SAM-dependent methyltransferase